MYNHHHTLNSTISTIIFILFITVFPGCKENKNTAERIITFRKANAINLSESHFFSNKTIISLETEEYSLIHDYSYVQEDGENLFIFSTNRASPILRFDIDGNFMNKIGSIGNGPNEFAKIFDVFINREKSIVEVLDGYRIIYFSYDGTPIKSEMINVGGNGTWAAAFTYVKDYYWFYTGNNIAISKYRLVQSDKNFNIVTRYLSDKSKMLPFEEYNFHQCSYHTFRETFYNNLYYIKEDSLYLAYTIDFGGIGIPAEVHKIPPLTVMEYLRNRHYAVINCYLENDNYIYMLIMENDANSDTFFYHWIIDKNNNYQEKIIKISNPELIRNSYLNSPQLLTDDNLLYFLGYPIENENDNDNIDYDLNPSIVIINLSENFP